MGSSAQKESVTPPPKNGCGVIGPPWGADFAAFSAHKGGLVPLCWSHIDHTGARRSWVVKGSAQDAGPESGANGVAVTGAPPQPHPACGLKIRTRGAISGAQPARRHAGKLHGRWGFWEPIYRHYRGRPRVTAGFPDHALGKPATRERQVAPPALPTPPLLFSFYPPPPPFPFSVCFVSCFREHSFAATTGTQLFRRRFSP